MAVSPMTAADMCADCAEPARWHGWSSKAAAPLIRGGPCPAWPEWAARVRSVRELLSAAKARPAAPAQPKPQPLAIVASGQPIDEVIAQFAKIHAENPNTVVRRGNRNRWEIWPA